MLVGFETTTLILHQSIDGGYQNAPNITSRSYGYLPFSVCLSLLISKPDRYGALMLRTTVEIRRKISKMFSWNAGGRAVMCTAEDRSALYP